MPGRNSRWCWPTVGGWRASRSPAHFPYPRPGEYICVYDVEDSEVLCVERPGTLPPPVLAILEEELARREFVPIIVRIEDVSADTDPATAS